MYIEADGTVWSYEHTGTPWYPGQAQAGRVVGARHAHQAQGRAPGRHGRPQAAARHGGDDQAGGARQGHPRAERRRRRRHARGRLPVRSRAVDLPRDRPRRAGRPRRHATAPPRRRCCSTTCATCRSWWSSVAGCAGRNLSSKVAGARHVRRPRARRAQSDRGGTRTRNGNALRRRSRPTRRRGRGARAAPRR